MDEKLGKTTTIAGNLRALAGWLLLVPASVILIISETYQPIVNAGLALLAAFFILYGLQGRLTARRTGLEIPLFIFIVSAGLSTWISYNQEAALLQFGRILTAAALYFAVAEDTPPFPEIVGKGFLAAAAGLAIFWVLKHDFSIEPGKLNWITSSGQWINSRFPTPPGPDIHKNVAGATLLLAAPFGLALVWQSWKHRQHFLATVYTILTGIVFFGLVMTSSLGAWLGLGAALGLGALAFIQRRWFFEQKGKRLFWASIALTGMLVLLALLATGSLVWLLDQMPDPTGSVGSRITLWRDGLSLLRNYVYTGSGLQTFWMTHAVYARLINVPYIASSHNSFLQVWIEQGVSGAVALIWGTIVILVWAWKSLDREDVPILGWAGLVVLFAAAVHGIIDVVYYVERILPAVGLPVGFAALVCCAESPRTSDLPRRDRRTLIALVGLAGLIAAGLVFRGPLLGAWYANLGALEQTRQELTRYDPNHYDEPSLEEVRRSADLDAAEVAFQKALDFQPANRTASQRLTMIALARQDYDQALNWIENAWNAGHRDTVTRLLYGDALVAAGELDQAVDLVSGIDWAGDRLFAQAWYRYWMNQDYQRAANAWRAVLLLDPANSEAVIWQTKAMQFLQP